MTVKRNRTTKSALKKRTLKRALGGSPRNILARDSKTGRLLEVARDAQIHGPQRVALPNGQVVIVSAPKKRKQVAPPKGTSTNLRTVLLNSPLADMKFESPREKSPVRDVEL